MDNQELIRTLDFDDLLSVIGLLVDAVKYPDTDFEGFEDHSYCLDDEVLGFTGKRYSEGVSFLEKLRREFG